MSTLRTALEQLRRDVGMVRKRLAGEVAPPVVRMGTPRKSEPAQVLEVARVIREASHTTTLVLVRPDGGTFEFVPGQFFTVLASIDGETVPRNYSASNAPGKRELHLTIKKKEGGRVSGTLSSLAAGATLRVLGPFGQFVVPEHAQRLVLIAGGAGITPMMSIIRSDARPTTLIYANREDDEVAFGGELSFHSHVTVRRVSGLLQRSVLADLVKEHGDATFLICGPDGMREEALAVLEGRDVHVERFTTGLVRSPNARGSRTIEVKANGKLHRGVALAGATLLEAGLAAGAPMPSSCSVGGCGACRVKLESGDVDMEEPNCLSDAERRAGYVLACVGRPEGPVRISLEST